MARKIIGVTVGTPMKPRAVIEKTEHAKKIEQNEKDIADLFKKVSAILNGGGSGSGSDLLKYVTFIGADGTELYKMPVLSGDDCKDPITHGDIATPTKASTADYTFTFSGWSLTNGGVASNTALSNVTEDRTLYAAFIKTAISSPEIPETPETPEVTSKAEIIDNVLYLTGNSTVEIRDNIIYLTGKSTAEIRDNILYLI